MIYIALSNNNGRMIDFEASEELSQRNIFLINQQLIYNINFTEICCKDRTLAYLMNYCLGTTVAVVLFDYTNLGTFARAEKIFESIEPCKVPINILIGNKVTNLIFLIQPKGRFN